MANDVVSSVVVADEIRKDPVNFSDVMLGYVIG